MYSESAVGDVRRGCLHKYARRRGGAGACDPKDGHGDRLAQIKVVKPKKLSTPTIAAAVESPREKAGPAAIENVTEEAERLAKAAGMTLGALQSVAELQSFPYGPFANYGLEGTFGPGKFCGTIRTPSFKTVKGRRVFQRRFRKHFGCRVPSNVTITVSATFAAA